GMKQKVLGEFAGFFSTEFVPRGFLQMIFLDTNGFDRQHYKIEYARREFLGEVRCLVFDVDPLPKAGKGRFVGRIWVEDQDFHIVRINGAYGGSSMTSRKGPMTIRHFKRSVPGPGRRKKTSWNDWRGKA